jgi:peptidoglycan/LPS O-acetylase OafA/YrhL
MEKIADSSSKIQPEIQFLRALAVSLVILGHSKFSWWSGGFVGVDMFFVVSGYVIGLSLIHERQQTNFNSLTRFFQRRFFRIFPPLAATIVGSCVYAYLILPFDRTQDYFIEQARAALFSYANFFFIFHKMDYFLHEGSSTFFLHTWSLGIEEQFYILVPLLIAIVGFRYRSKVSSDHFRIWRNVFRTIALISVISAFVIHSNVYTFSTPEFSRLVLFYSPLTRSWEFFVGMLIALHLSTNSPTDSKHLWSKFNSRSALGTLMALLLISLVGYQQELLSQFSASSLTAVGTGLFIAMRTKFNLAENRFIRHRVIQTIGNASYSIYLWHWIGVSIAADVFRPNSLDPDNSLETSILILLSLIPAFLSYRIIEIPFRKVRFLATRPKIIIGVSLVLIPVICLTLLRSTMLSTREEYGNVYPSTVLEGCDFWGELCTVGSKDASKRILVFGDSHAYQLIPMIKEYVEVHNIELTTCVKVCKDENLAKIGDGSFSERHFNLIITSISGMVSRDDRKTFASNFNLFTKSQNSLHLVVLDNPFFANQVSPRRIKHPVLEPLDRNAQTDMRAPNLTDLVSDSDAKTIFFDPFDSLCNEEICFTEYDGKALYLDNNHYSMTGSNLIQPNLYKTLDSLLGN